MKPMDGWEAVEFVGRGGVPVGGAEAEDEAFAGLESGGEVGTVVGGGNCSWMWGGEVER